MAQYSRPSSPRGRTTPRSGHAGPPAVVGDPPRQPPSRQAHLGPQAHGSGSPPPRPARSPGRRPSAIRPCDHGASRDRRPVGRGPPGSSTATSPAVPALGPADRGQLREDLLRGHPGRPCGRPCTRSRRSTPDQSLRPEMTRSASTNVVGTAPLLVTARARAIASQTHRRHREGLTCGVRVTTTSLTSDSTSSRASGTGTGVTSPTQCDESRGVEQGHRDEPAVVGSPAIRRVLHHLGVGDDVRHRRPRRRRRRPRRR